MGKHGKKKGKRKGKGAQPKANKPATSNDGKDKKYEKNATDEQKGIDETSDGSKAEYLVAGDPKKLGEISTKPGKSKDKAFLVCAPLLPNEVTSQSSMLLKFPKPIISYENLRGKICIPRKVFKELNEEIEDKTDLKLNPSMPTSNFVKQIDPLQKALNEQLELALERSKEATRSETGAIKCTSLVASSGDIGCRNLNLDLKSSEVQAEPFSKNEIEETEQKKEGHELTQLQHGFRDDESKSSFGLKSSKPQQVCLKNKILETWSKENECIPIVQSIQDMEERLRNQDLKNSGVQAEPSSKNEIEETEQKKEGNELTQLQHGFRNDESKSSFGLKSSKTQQVCLKNKILETWSKENEFKPIEQSIQVIDERLRNLDLKSSEVQAEPSSKNEIEETEQKKEGNKLPQLQHGFCNDESKSGFGLKSSKLKQVCLKNKILETWSKENEFVPIVQSIQDIEEGLRNLDLKNTESQEVCTSEKQTEKSEYDSKENKIIPLNQNTEDTEKRNEYLHLKISESEKLPLTYVTQDTDGRFKTVCLKKLDLQKALSSEKEVEDESKYLKITEIGNGIYNCDPDDQIRSLDKKNSESHELFSSEKEMEKNESNPVENKTIPVNQNIEDLEKRIRNLHLKKSELQKLLSLEKEGKDESKLKTNEILREWRGFNITEIGDRRGNLALDDPIPSLDHKNSESQEVYSLEKETENNESNSEDTDKRRSYLKKVEFLRYLSLQEKPNKSKSKGNESMPLSQGLNITKVSNRKRESNLDLHNSKSQKISALDDQRESRESKPEECERTIYLPRDVNLRFEFANLDNKTIWVNRKQQFTVDQNQKISFDVGNGNLKLSFIDNKVSIFAEESDIICSFSKNGIVFSLTDSSTTRSISLPEEPSTNLVSKSNDTMVPKNIDAVDEFCITN